jgi:hypothetical protein
MKKSESAPVSTVQSPAIFVNDEDGNQCGILNLHTSIKAFWDQIRPEKLFEMQNGAYCIEQKKGTTVAITNSNGKVIEFAWVNGNDEGKQAFIAKIGKEPLRFSVPVTAADMGDLI